VPVDTAARRAWRGERELAPPPREFDLLALLVAEAGVAAQRRWIMDEVWGANRFGSTKTLDMDVAFLRRKRRPPGALTTVRGVGFRLEG
jgi:DNA-binding response OmpR family regulator